MVNNRKRKKDTTRVYSI